MAFRDLLGAASIISEPTSVLHGIFDKSKSVGHELLVFENLLEAPGHRVAVNFLTRPRLCAALSIEPEDFIDLLGWAMTNPGEPKIVENGPWSGFQKCHGSMLSKFHDLARDADI